MLLKKNKVALKYVLRFDKMELKISCTRSVKRIKFKERQICSVVGGIDLLATSLRTGFDMCFGQSIAKPYASAPPMRRQHLPANRRPANRTRRFQMRSRNNIFLPVCDEGGGVKG